MNGRVHTVVTSSGTRLPCDFAVLGLGVEPIADFLDGSGIEVDDGIVVDERCRASLDGVFAAGDVVRGASLVVWAVRDGRDAAERIHGYLTAKAQAALAIAAE